ncbi:MAG: argininosuccinate lyase [Proteobacteria bacterium]|nr:argininosuccinate lyase [Pseudomonadota bacterium]
MAEKPWGGRFAEKTHDLLEKFSESISYDKRLYPYDIRGSIAHCKMLAKQEIIPQADSEKIIAGLEEILQEIESGQFQFSEALEDIHMNIEKRLIDKIGDVGGKLHTARSRNDQVALDTKLYLRDTIKDVINLLGQFRSAIAELAKNNSDVIMPGYTHLQRAQPVLFANHMMAYCDMLQRDSERFDDCLKRVNVLPLGAGALAGTTFPIDREYVAGLLDFPAITRNSLDTVSDRDFVIEFCSASSILMMHLSRLSEELILWSSDEFDFIEISDAFCTGSSIMPQKKNPDIPELTRGKTGRVYGNLIAILTVMKGLPLAYNRDMQEDKEPLFDTIDTVMISVQLFTEMMKNIEINKGKMFAAAGGGYSTATEVADYLVRKGLPFRDAHAVVGNIVKYCISKDIAQVGDLSLDEFRGFSDSIENDIYEYVDLVKSTINKSKLFKIDDAGV